MTDPARPTSNARYGRYEVLFRIASGGMAEVYVARIVGEGGFEKLVALKRMLPTLAEDERFVGMFLDEGRVAANISSPHVVQTLDLGRADDDSLYLVMELCVGVSLAALMRVLSKEKTQIPLPLAVELLAQAASGLEDAHEARTIYGEPLGIVHRDVSPHNVLVDVSGRVRITDFGVARALERVTQTQSGEVKGKLAYFAPEQARAKPLDRRADVYALGIVAWEVVTGHRLFQGEGPADTLTKVLEMEAPRIESIRTDAPASLGDAIAGALERDLGKRTATAGDFAEALRAALPASGASKLGSFVRSRGGESLLRLEEGIRSLNPSSPSARLGVTSKAPPPMISAEPNAAQLSAWPNAVEEPTTRTPSHVSLVQDRAAARAPVAPVPSVEPHEGTEAATSLRAAPAAPAAVVSAVPAPAPAGGSRVWIGVAATVVLALGAGGAYFALARAPEPVVSTPLASPPEVAPAVAPTPPPTPAGLTWVSEPAPAPAVVDDLPSGERAPRRIDREAEAGAAEPVAPALLVEDPGGSTEVVEAEAEPERTTARRGTARRGEASGVASEPTRDDPPAAGAEEGGSGRRPSALRGMDDFDSEVGAN